MMSWSVCGKFAIQRRNFHQWTIAPSVALSAGHHTLPQQSTESQYHTSRGLLQGTSEAQYCLERQEKKTQYIT
jgi:hypothetical protein